MKFKSKLPLTNKYVYFGAIILLVAILTGINNFYFYDHIERSTERNAAQLEKIIKNEIYFCRKNRISGIRYRNNIEAIVKKFASTAYYNDKIILKHEKKGLVWKKPSHEWDKVAKSDIEIIIPKLKSKNPLYFDVKTTYSTFLFFQSVIRSMTFSIIPDISKKIIDNNTTNLTDKEKMIYEDLENKKDKLDNLKEDAKKYLKMEYESTLTAEDDKKYTDIKKEIQKYQLSHEEYELYYKLKKQIRKNTLFISTYWYRSRPALGFALFAIILIWLVRRREEEMNLLALMSKEPEIYSNSDILNIILALRNGKFSEIRKLVEEGTDINAVNDKKQTALMLYSSDDTEAKHKLKAAKALISNGADVNLKNNEGETALMLYTLRNNSKNNNGAILELLISHGAKINAKNNAGMTAAMLATMKDKDKSLKILLDNEADINIKQEVRLKDLASSKEVRALLKKTHNNNPQELVKILSNFTNKPMKFTTHDWDFGSLKSVFGTFDEAMEAVKKQFNSFEDVLKELSPNLYKKIDTFLFNTDPNLEYSWCSKSEINIGWLSLDGLKEFCDNGNNAYDFKLNKSIFIGYDEIVTFGEVIDLFKQEIEIRTDFQSLETIFSTEQEALLDEGFLIDISNSKLQRQFYTDTEKFQIAIKKIFNEIKKRKVHKTVKLETKELEDRSIEIRITQIDSSVNKDVKTLYEDIYDGDFADIKDSLSNLCDWSVESICEDGNFRVNYLHSNNVKEIETLSEGKVKGFTHILRFYR